MSDHVDSVREYLHLMARWRKNAATKGEQHLVANYDKRMAFLQALVDEVEDLRRVTKPIPASYGDLSDLPPELMKELSGIKVDDLEQQIFTIIKSGGDEVDLDAVLIELFRRFKVVQTRKFLQNKLWRMAQKELIFSVPSRKGVYSAVKTEYQNHSEYEASAPLGSHEAQTNQRPSFDDDLDDDVAF
jgi:hypothetical protein